MPSTYEEYTANQILKASEKSGIDYWELAKAADINCHPDDFSFLGARDKWKEDKTLARFDYWLFLATSIEEIKLMLGDLEPEHEEEKRRALLRIVEMANKETPDA